MADEYDSPKSTDLDKMKLDKDWYPGSPKSWNPKSSNYVDEPNTSKKSSPKSGDVTILRGGKEPEVKKFAKGGLVRRDGIASRGKTRGRFV